MQKFQKNAKNKPNISIKKEPVEYACTHKHEHLYEHVHESELGHLYEHQYEHE